MVYTIRTIEGNDIMSEEFPTHQEALYHLCTDDEYAESGKTREERERVLHIVNSEAWYMQEPLCPQCKQPAMYIDGDMDIIQCFTCGSNEIVR